MACGAGWTDWTRSMSNGRCSTSNLGREFEPRGESRQPEWMTVLAGASFPSFDLGRNGARERAWRKKRSSAERLSNADIRKTRLLRER